MNIYWPIVCRSGSSDFMYSLQNRYLTMAISPGGINNIQESEHVNLTSITCDAGFLHKLQLRYLCEHLKVNKIMIKITYVNLFCISAFMKTLLIS